jgi:hypothetical protein
MKKASLTIMVISAIGIALFTYLFWHPVTDNAVDSNGFWCYMYGAKSTLWPVYSLSVIFLMGLTCYMSTFTQKSVRVN